MIEMSKKKYLVMAVIFFFLGVVFAPKGKTVEVCTRETTWSELKVIDDKGFVLSSEAMGIMSNAFTATANFDVDQMERETVKLNDKTSEITKLSTERQSKLKELGY